MKNYVAQKNPKNQYNPEYHIRNRSEELDQLLKPCSNFKKLKFDSKERFTTSNSIHFKDQGKQQREGNIHLEKDDLRFTRRIMETHNNHSISVGANVTHSLGCKKDAINRLKKYVGGEGRKGHHRNISPLVGDNTVYDKKAILQNPRDEDGEINVNFEWTPARFNQYGWKY